MGAKRKNQTEIPGTERPTHKDIEKKAAQLYDVRQQRMALSAEEGALAEVLLGLLKKHGLTEYDDGDLTISIVAIDERVKVKKKKDDDG